MSITLLACEMRAIVRYFEHCLALPFFQIGMKTDLSYLISDLLRVTLVPFDMATYAGNHYGVHLFFMGNSTSRFTFSEQNVCINAKI